MKEITRRIISWASGKPEGPFNIELNPTDRCNLRCVFCGTIEKKKSENWDYSIEMGRERLLQIVREGIELGAKAWRISGGGEAMVFSETTIQIMQLIKENGGHGDLTTNGTLFTDKAIEEIAALRWDSVEFSLDAASPRIHNKLRQGKKAFEKAIDAINKFQEYKKFLGSSKPEIHFKSILLSENFKEVPEMVLLAEKLGCTKFILEPIAVCTEEGERLRLSERQSRKFQKILKKFLPALDRLKIQTNLRDFLEEDEFVRKIDVREKLLEEEARTDVLLPVVCFQPWYNMVIRPEGNVSPCCVFYSSGRELSKMSLREVWFGDYFTEIRRRILTNDLPDVCATCHIEHISKNRTIKEDILNNLDEENKGLFHKQWLYHDLNAKRMLK